MCRIEKKLGEKRKPVRIRKYVACVTGWPLLGEWKSRGILVRVQEFFEICWEFPFLGKSGKLWIFKILEKSRRSDDILLESVLGERCFLVLGSVVWLPFHRLRDMVRARLPVGQFQKWLLTQNPKSYFICILSISFLNTLGWCSTTTRVTYWALAISDNQQWWKLLLAKKINGKHLKSPRSIGTGYDRIVLIAKMWLRPVVRAFLFLKHLTCDYSFGMLIRLQFCSVPPNVQ